MTKKDYEEKYVKALKEGKKMLERSKELKEKSLELCNNNSNDSEEYRQGLLLYALSDELIDFYEKMFN